LNEDDGANADAADDFVRYGTAAGRKEPLPMLLPPPALLMPRCDLLIALLPTLFLALVPVVFLALLLLDLPLEFFNFFLLLTKVGPITGMDVL
jgi:hypothetical protein